jgi:hypothetical protein
VFIIKIVGFDILGIDLNNPYILKLNEIILKYNLQSIWYAIMLYINVYIVLSITCNDNSKKMKLYTLICMPICIYIQITKSVNKHLIFVIIDFIYIFVLGLIYKKFKFNKDNYLNYIFITILMMLFQVISLVTRDYNINLRLEGNFIAQNIMSIDYILINIIFYKFYFLKGGKSIWTVVHYSGLDLMTALRKLPRKFQKKFQNKEHKKLTKEQKVYNLIFYSFVIIYNLFSMAVIFLIAYFLHSVIECIFITLSFWINKFAFGKPFHAKDTKTCFVISSASYIILNKLATSTIGISFLWQIILGVMFSFITSRFVKNTIRKLYRGMPIDEFNKSISKVTDKDSLQYKICYMYYIDRKSELEISYSVNYSVDNIKKIKSKINKKIVELN